MYTSLYKKANEAQREEYSEGYASSRELLSDCVKEYEKLNNAIRALLKGEKTGEEVNATAKSILDRIDGLIDDYEDHRKAIGRGA